MTLPRCVIVDVDGTLVDVSGARHYVLRDRNRKDFTSFHAAALWCPPVTAVLDVVHGLQARGVPIVVLTSRKQEWEYGTRRWLAGNGVVPTVLGMRAQKDQRPDAQVKRDLLTQVRARFDPVLAIDDNPSILALWAAEGIPAVRVPGWVHD